MEATSDGRDWEEAGSKITRWCPMGGRAYAWAGVAVPHTKLEDGDDGIIVHSMIIPREAEESTRLYATVLVVTLAIRASLRFDSHACGMMSHGSLDKGMIQLRVG